MKCFLISLLFFFFSSQQKASLSGSYKFEFKNSSYLQNGTIVFNDSVYSMELTKSLKSVGNINYGKNLTSIDGFLYPNIVIDFSTKDIEKDTIDFQVHNKKGGVMNYLDVSINSGKLIKIK